MKTVNAIKKLEKAGFKIKEVGTGVYNRRFVAKKADMRHFVEFLTQGGTDTDMGNVTVVDLRTEGQEDDLQSDYHAGTFCDNISQAIRLVNC